MPTDLFTKHANNVKKYNNDYDNDNGIDKKMSIHKPQFTNPYGGVFATRHSTMMTNTFNSGINEDECIKNFINIIRNDDNGITLRNKNNNNDNKSGFDYLISYLSPLLSHSRIFSSSSPILPNHASSTSTTSSSATASSSFSSSSSSVPLSPLSFTSAMHPSPISIEPYSIYPQKLLQFLAITTVISSLWIRRRGTSASSSFFSSHKVSSGNNACHSYPACNSYSAKRKVGGNTGGVLFSKFSRKKTYNIYDSSSGKFRANDTGNRSAGINHTTTTTTTATTTNTSTGADTGATSPTGAINAADNSSTMGDTKPKGGESISDSVKKRPIEFVKYNRGVDTNTGGSRVTGTNSHYQYGMMIIAALFVFSYKSVSSVGVHNGLLAHQLSFVAASALCLGALARYVLELVYIDFNALDGFSNNHSWVEGSLTGAKVSKRHGGYYGGYSHPSYQLKTVKPDPNGNHVGNNIPEVSRKGGAVIKTSGEDDGTYVGINNSSNSGKDSSSSSNINYSTPSVNGIDVGKIIDKYARKSHYHLFRDTSLHFFDNVISMPKSTTGVGLSSLSPTKVPLSVQEVEHLLRKEQLELKLRLMNSSINKNKLVKDEKDDKAQKGFEEKIFNKHDDEILTEKGGKNDDDKIKNERKIENNDTKNINNNKVSGSIPFIKDGKIDRDDKIFDGFNDIWDNNDHRLMVSKSRRIITGEEVRSKMEEINAHAINCMMNNDNRNNNYGFIDKSKLLLQSSPQSRYSVNFNDKVDTINTKDNSDTNSVNEQYDKVDINEKENEKEGEKDGNRNDNSQNDQDTSFSTLFALIMVLPFASLRFYYRFKYYLYHYVLSPFVLPFIFTKLLLRHAARSRLIHLSVAAALLGWYDYGKIMWWFVYAPELVEAKGRIESAHGFDLFEGTYDKASDKINYNREGSQSPVVED